MTSGRDRDHNRRQPGVAADDVKLFREAVRDIKPLPPPNRIVHSPKPAPVPIQSLLDNHDALAASLNGASSPEQSMETGEELVFLRPGLPLNVLRQLRRGRWIAQDALDLHGLTQVQARAALAEFFAECLRRRLRCVRIVHGKGLRSPNREPVLKGKLHLWLAHRNEILAYCQAPQNLGGSGALLVLLSA